MVGDTECSNRDNGGSKINQGQKRTDGEHLDELEGEQADKAKKTPCALESVLTSLQQETGEM